MERNIYKRGKELFVTSDEEIKEGDWNLPPSNIPVIYDGQKFKGDEPLKCWKKIILTTDQDLIKDGVQAIDDEFLEWFVKNPSCEFVEVEIEFLKLVHNPKYNDFTSKGDGIYLTPIEENLQNTETLIEDNVPYYKIIIPKEETKQLDEKWNPLTYWGGKEEVKQETIEEAADRYFPFAEKIGGETYTAYRGFIEGAKWQEQNSDKKYSEEEVYNLLYKLLPDKRELDEWFEQFKNK